jgi:hypothetical protein
VQPDELDWCFRWLYAPRNDVRPRVLIFSTKYCPNGITFLLDRIKQVYFVLNEIIIINFFQKPGLSQRKPSNQLSHLHCWVPQFAAGHFA